MERKITLFFILFTQAATVITFALYAMRASLRISFPKVLTVDLLVVIGICVIYSQIPPPHPLAALCVVCAMLLGIGSLFLVSTAPRGQLLYVFMTCVVQLFPANTVWMVVTELFIGSAYYESYGYFDLMLLIIPLVLSLPLFYLTLRAVWGSARNLPEIPWFRLFLIPLSFMLIYIIVYLLKAVGRIPLFAECVIMVVITLGFYITATQLAYALRCAAQASYSTEHLRHVESQIALQGARLREIGEHREETRRLRHDLRQHMAAVYALQQEKKYDRADAYMAEYLSQIELPGTPLCDNEIVDSMARYYLAMAEANHIRSEISISLPASSAIQDTDLSVLLGNLLENAIESCRRINGAGERWLELRVYPKNKLLLISLRNACGGIIRQNEQGDFLSEKHEGVGIGLSSVTRIAERYQGMSRFYPEGDAFVSEVVLKALDG